MITGLSHVSIVVPDIAAAARKLERLYGLRTEEPKINEEQGVKLAYVNLPNARIELMEPARTDSPIAKFLERNPKGGLHHFCLTVDSVDDTARALAERGARVLGDSREQRNVHGERIAFVHPADFLGALVELEDPHG
jgi:methylmalonyl-CoA/ethylmalonyl-CoA epimerase